MNRELIRESVEIGGIISAFIGTTVLLAIWTLVYVNGGSVTLTIQAFGEQFFELVMFWVMVPFMGVAFWLYLRGPER